MLKDAQMATLRVVADDDPEAVGYMQAADDVALAEWFNTASTFVVYHTRVEESEFTDNLSADGTSLSWTVFIGRSQGERDGWRAMFQKGWCDPSKANVRQGFADIFSGGTGAAQRAHMSSIAKRFATRAEHSLAVGTGTTADPGLLVFEGFITFAEASNIRSL